MSNGDFTRPARDHRAPLLIVVTGAPASGKSTIARELAKRLGVPLLAKDAFKETLYETIGSGEEVEDTSEHAGLALLYRLAAMQLEAGVSVLTESNFDTRTDLGPLRRLQREHRARLVQVHCHRAKEKLLDRFVERLEEGKRHPGHGDEPEDVLEVEEKLEDGVWDALDLPGDLIEVDKDVEEFSCDRLAEQVRAVAAA